MMSNRNVVVLVLAAIFFDVLATPACGSSGDGPSGAKDAGPDGIFLGDPSASAATSTIRADPSSVPANRTSTTRFTVTVKNAAGTPISQEAVTLTSSGKGNKFSLATGLTDEQGVFTATLSSTWAEAKTVTAAFGRVSIATQVTFDLCHGSTFPTFATNTTGGGPDAVTAGDFNADGALDLAVANGNTNDVTILLGRGDGTFAPAPSFVAVGRYPQALVADDFNGDHKLDLAVVNSSDSNVSILFGKGDGTFSVAAATAGPVGNDPRAIVSGYFNADTILDLAVTNYGSDNVSVLVGQGNGAFSATAINSATGMGTGPYSLVTADFDGDHIADLAIANYSANNVSIMKGAGNGTFSSLTTGAVGTGPESVALGDFDADGTSDLAVANFMGPSVSVLLGVAGGRGTLKPSVFYPTSDLPCSVLVTDFDADGNQDLAIARTDATAATVLFGKGHGLFGQAVDYPAAGGDSRALATGDFDGDHKPDLAVVNRTAGTVSVGLNSGCVP